MHPGDVNSGHIMKIRFHPGLTSLAGSIAIRGIGATWRIETRGSEHLEAARKIAPQVILTCWHGRLLVLSYTHRNQSVQVLASEHEDGDLMGRTITWLGFGHVRGSTSRGGARALRELSSLLEDGLDVGLTIDGPRGPRGVVQQGAVELSRITGSVIVPISNSSRPRHLFGSWDRFQLPHPFSRIVVAYGEPFVVPPDAGKQEREGLRLDLQKTLERMTRELDEELGYIGPDVWPHEDI